MKLFFAVSCASRNAAAPMPCEMNSNADSGDVLRVGCFNNEIHGQAFTRMLSFCTHPKAKRLRVGIFLSMRALSPVMTITINNSLLFHRRDSNRSFYPINNVVNMRICMWIGCIIYPSNSLQLHQ